MIFSRLSVRVNSGSVTTVNSPVLVALSRGALVGIFAVGLLAIISGLLDLSDSGNDTPSFLIFGTLITICCAYLTRYVSEKKLNRSESFLAVTSGFLSSILCSSFIYLFMTDEKNFANALFESTAAFTTTSLTVIDFGMSGNGLIFYRTASQLFGSFAAILLAVMVLPIADNNSRSLTSGRHATQETFPDRRKALKSISSIYLVSIVLLTLTLLTTPVDFFEALLLSISSISTGGFSISSEHFGNSSVQLLLSAGMITTGMSILVIWRLVSGKIYSAIRSSELHAYFLLIVVASLLLFLWSDEGGTSSLSSSLFIALASISTTGFHIPPFGNWSEATAFLLLFLVTVGPMSLSNGGGFQIHRLRILIAVSFRELVRQLHPRAVVKIIIGDESIKEERVREVVVFQFLFTSVIFLTAIALTISGMSMYEGVSSSITAISTAGPIRNAEGVIIEVSSFSVGERLALLPAMISGRLYLIPVLISIGYLLSEARTFLRPRRRLLQAMRSDPR